MKKADLEAYIERTYGQVADHLGNKNLARVEGNILHNNPDPEKIPCHRVINS